MRAFPAALVTAAVAVVAALAGCAQTAPPGSETTPTPTPTPSPSATPLSTRPVTLQVGVPVDLSQTRGLAKATVTIVSIEEGAACASGEETPELGQFVAVTVSGSRGADPTFDFATYDWTVVAVDGTESDARATVVTGRCVPEADQLSAVYDVTGYTEGVVLLDAPAALARIHVTNTLANPAVTITVEMPPR